MLTFLKALLHEIFPPLAYTGGLLLLVYAVIKDVRVGVLLLVALIPQPNLWYKFHEYPLGKDFIDILFLACVLGIILQKKMPVSLPNTLLLLSFIAVNYLALINTSLNFHLPFPFSGENRLLLDWKNYAQMILLYFIVARSVETEREAQILTLVMTFVVLLVGYRAYKSFYAGDSFSYGKRAGGPFEQVGLGANHLGAFMAHSIAMLAAMFLSERELKTRLVRAAAIAFGTLALLYSYSRGAYLAIVAVMVYFGIRRKPILLAACLVLFVAWKTLLPHSVIERITMTSQDGQIESSAAHRLDLWEHAKALLLANPIFGVGYGGFGFTVPEGELTDTHNVYMKILSEQGIVGFAFLMIIFLRMFISGNRLLRVARSPYLKGLGLGMTGAVAACMVTNMFGDRWSYFVLGGFLWVWWGLVDKMTIIEGMRESGELLPGVSGHDA